MKREVRVLVSCGSGLVTSALMEQALIDIKEKNHLDSVRITKIGMTAIPSYLNDVDILVTTGEYSGDSKEVIKLTGTPLLLGVGKDEFIKKFIEAVKEVEER